MGRAESRKPPGHEAVMACAREAAGGAESGSVLAMFGI